MKSKNTKTEQRIRRHARIRAKVFGTAERPRLAIFKSNKYISAQIIDDTQGKTLAASRDASAALVGAAIAAAAKGKGIATVVFDRGGRKYAGNVKVLADAAREGGLQF